MKDSMTKGAGCFGGLLVVLFHHTWFILLIIIGVVLLFDLDRNQAESDEKRQTQNIISNFESIETPAIKRTIDTPKPTATSQPTATPRPVMTLMPTLSSQPTATPRPVMTLMPTLSSKPTMTSKPKTISKSTTPLKQIDKLVQYTVPPHLLSAAYKHGKSSPETIEVKKKMLALGYFSPNSDLSEWYNDTVVERVKLFQKNNDLKQTGLIDLAFLTALYSENPVMTGNYGLDISNRSNKTNHTNTATAVLGGFEPSETWKKVSGVSVSDVVADTVHFTTGTQGLKITSQNGTTTYAQRKSITLNLSAANYLQYDVYVEQPSLLATVCILLHTDDDNYFITYDTLASIQAKPLKDNWRRCKLNLSELQKSGSPSLANITKILIQVNSTSGNTASITFDNMIAVPSAVLKGKVTIRFDDGFSNISLAKAIFDKYAFRGVVAIIPSKVGATGYATVLELLAMQDAGWDIVNHTATHASLGSASEETVRASIGDASIWMVDNGFIDHGIVVIPGHVTSSTVQAVSEDISVITCSGRHGSDTLPPENWQMLRYIRGDAQTAATIKAYIDAVESDKSWATILFHSVSSDNGKYSVSPAILDEILAYILTKNVDLVTYSDILLLFDYYDEVRQSIG